MIDDEEDEDDYEEDEEEDEEEDFGSCDRCGCDLLDPWEAEDGLCEQCSWLIEQCDGDEF